MTKKYSFPKDKIKILLLEGVHESADAFLKSSHYTNVKKLQTSLSEEELIKELSDTHILGIRSKTQVTKNLLKSAPYLLSIGCFCIGTNQVDLNAATNCGVPVFNAPFSNTRSVAELTVALVVTLARRVFEKSQKMHQGIWQKSAIGSYEVKGKTLGIIGYGHIGSQVSLLAESYGMNVISYDIQSKLTYGTAKSKNTLESVLSESDFVTLHVPETETTKNMITEDHLKAIKKNGYLINLSRGSVVDLNALKRVLESGHLAGAAVDVFPKEPKSNDEPFESVLQGIPNVILTPHIAGATLEAQEKIGKEVAENLAKYIDSGITSTAVNFPKVNLPDHENCHRLLNIHRNVPGALHQINGVIAELGINIEAQYLSTFNEIGYLVMDVSENTSKNLKEQIEKIDINIKTRLLF